MSEISRKKSIIKKRQETFKAHQEKGITKKRILGVIFSGARYVHKVATSEKTKNLFTRIGKGATRFAEAQREKPTKRRKKQTGKKSRR